MRAGMCCSHDEVVSDTYDERGNVLTWRCVFCGTVLTRLIRWCSR